MTEKDACTTCAPGDTPTPTTSAGECCALEAVVSIDERGQLVLPKELRVRAGIAPGERMAVVSYTDDDGAICCITLVKAGAVAGAVRSVIGPALGLDA